MEQHDPAFALAGRGDERRPVGQSRPDLRIHGDGGVGQHLAINFHVIGHGKTAEGARGFERRQWLWRAPGQRAAKRAAAAAQSDREQLVAALFEARAGKANEHAARFEPSIELFLGAGDELANIGEHDGRHFVVDQLMHAQCDIGFFWRDDVGVRYERALDIIER